MQYLWMCLCISLSVPGCPRLWVCFYPLFIQPLSSVARSQARYWTSGGGLSPRLITSIVWLDVDSKQKSFPEKCPGGDRGIHAMRAEHREPEPLKPGT